MNVLTKASAPRYCRQEGITSYLLASPRTCQAKHLTTTFVQIQPGGEQRIHHHVSEQVYFILEGVGQMTVGAETKQVGPGDCVFIPSDTPHGVKNQTGQVLTYFSAAAPAFDQSELLALWTLGSERDELGAED